MTLFALLLVPTSLALQVPLTPEELCELSDRVVIAEVTSSEVIWSQDPSAIIETHAWLATHRTVRGDASQGIEVLLPGGTLDGITVDVEDTPTLNIDHRYLLFLAEGRDHRFVVLGGERGAVPIGFSPENERAALSSLGACGR